MLVLESIKSQISNNVCNFYVKKICDRLASMFAEVFYRLDLKYFEDVLFSLYFGVKLERKTLTSLTVLFLFCLSSHFSVLFPSF